MYIGGRVAAEDWLGACVPEALTEWQFKTLRFWAMTFSTSHVARPGIAVWPLFRYTPEQRKRLHEMGRAAPIGTRLIWVAVFVLIWVPVGTLIGTAPLAPLIAIRFPPHPSLVVLILLPAVIGANFMSALVLGAVGAAWAAGRITAPLLLAQPQHQDNGDAELLAHIQRQIRRAVVFGLGAAIAPGLLSLVIRGG